MTLTKSPREVYQGLAGDPAFQPSTADAAQLATEMRAEYMAVADGQNRLAAADLATTANITLSGEQTVDGTLTSASRVLVKNQSTASQNGVYVTAAGAWSRAADANTSEEIALAFVHVIGGSANAGKRYQVVNKPTLGTDAVTWAEVGFSADLASEVSAREAALAAEAAAREAAEAKGDTLRLTSIAGTGDAITAVVPADQAHIPLAVGQTLDIRIANVNTGSAEITITHPVSGAATFGLRTRNGSELPAGALQVGATLRCVIHTSDRIRIQQALTPGDTGAATAAQGALADSAVQPGDLGDLALKDTITGADIDDGSVPFAAMADRTAGTVIGRKSGGADGRPEELDGDDLDDILDLTARLAAEADAREAAENLGAIIRLANVAGTGDAVTADVPAAQAHITMGAGQLVVWRQPADNSGSVTLTVGGIGYGVRSRGGSDLPAGALVEASRYVGVVHSTGGEPRIRVMTPLSAADLAETADAKIMTGAERTALAAASVAIADEVEAREALITSKEVEGTDDADPAGLITSDSGQIAAMVRRDGAFAVPALRLGGATAEIAATAEGGINLGPLGLTLLPGGDGIVALVADEDGRVAAYLTDDGVLVTPGPDPARARPETLAAQIGDPLTSLRINLIGDSITWGSTLAANGVSTPRTGQLSDPRDVLTNGSWANRLRRWIVAAALGTTATITATAPGRGEARSSRGLRPYDDPRLVREGPWGARALTGSVYGQVLALPPGSALEVHFRGDQIDLIHAVTIGDADATASVTIDGVAQPDLAHGGAVAATGAVYDLDLAYGDHVLRVVNDNATSDFLIEQVLHHRLILVQNDGIIGRSSAHWVPGGLLLDAALAPGYDWVFCQIGTNDRATATLSGYAAALTGIVGAITAAGARPVLLTANACPASDATPFGLTMADISGATDAVASALGIAHIDQYHATLIDEGEGVTYLADGLHPDETGHRIMARTLITAIANGDI